MPACCITGGDGVVVEDDGLLGDEHGDGSEDAAGEAGVVRCDEVGMGAVGSLPCEPKHPGPQRGKDARSARWCWADVWGAVEGVEVASHCFEAAVVSVASGRGHG